MRWQYSKNWSLELRKHVKTQSKLLLSNNLKKFGLKNWLEHGLDMHCWRQLVHRLKLLMSHQPESFHRSLALDDIITKINTKIHSIFQNVELKFTLISMLPRFSNRKPPIWSSSSLVFSETWIFIARKHEKIKDRINKSYEKGWELAKWNENFHVSPTYTRQCFPSSMQR